MIKNIQRYFLFGVCSIFAVRASEDFKNSEWREYAQLVKARSAFRNQNYQEALRLYQNLDVEYHKSPTAFKQHRLVTQGLWLTHTMLGDYDASRDHIKGLIFCDPLVTALHAASMQECKEKNNCIAYSLSKQQPLAAIMAGDQACSKGELEKACNYYIQAAELIGAEESTIAAWYTDLLQYRKAQLMYQFDSTISALDTLKKLHNTTQFQSIKKDIYACFSRIINQDKSVIGLCAFAECVDLTEHKQAGQFLNYLKLCLNKETVIPQSLEQLQQAVDKVAGLEALQEEHIKILLDYYEKINTDRNQVLCAQKAYRLLDLTKKNDGKLFVKKIEAILMGFKDSPEFCRLCFDLIRQGIDTVEPISKKDRKKISQYVDQLEKEPNFNQFLKDQDTLLAWNDFKQAVNQNSAEKHIVKPLANKVNQSLTEHDELQQLIVGDALNAATFDLKIMPYLRKHFKSSRRHEQEKALEIVFLLAGHEALVANSNMSEIKNSLIAVKNNHKEHQHMISYYVFCMEQMLRLRQTEKFSPEFIRVSQEIIDKAVRKRDSVKNQKQIAHYYDKLIGDLHYMLAITYNKMYLEKKHNAILNSTLITNDDLELLKTHKNCMLAALATYELLKKEASIDKQIAQDCLVKVAEIAMRYPDLFSECTKKTPFKTAKDALQNYLKDKPESINVRFLLADLFAGGIALEINGKSQLVGKDVGLAVQELNRLRVLKTGYGKLAKCLRMLKKEAEAQVCYEEGIVQTHDPALYLEYVSYLLEKNKLPDAVKTINEVMALNLDAHQKHKADLLQLLCFIKEKHEDVSQYVSLLKTIPVTTCQSSLFQSFHKNFNSADAQYFDGIVKKIYEQQNTQPDYTEVLASVGVLYIKLSHCQEDESKSYNQYIQGLKLLEDMAKRNCLPAAQILGSDPIYYKNKTLRENFITHVGQELLATPASQAFEKRKILIPFKDSLRAQLYLLLCDFTLRHDNLGKALIDTGCLIMAGSSEYAYGDDEIEDGLIKLANQAFQLDADSESMPTDILKKIWQGLSCASQSSTMAEVAQVEIDILGKYGIYTFLTRLNIVAAKYSKNLDKDKTQLYLERAFDCLLDLAMTVTKVVAPKNHALRVQHFIQELSTISNSLEADSGLKYYEDLCDLLLQSKMLYEQRWADLACIAGEHMLKKSIADNDPVQQSIAIQYLEIAASNFNNSAIDALVEYNSNLLDVAVKKHSTVSTIESFAEIKQALKWLAMGKNKKNSVAIQALLKYYTRALNQEENKPSNEKNYKKIKEYSNHLKDACELAGPILSGYVVIKEVAGAKNYEVLYDMDQHALMPYSPENAKNLVVRYV